MGNFLRTQGQLLLGKDRYAFLAMAFLPFIPFAAWLSLVVMSLVTLRKGAHTGFKLMMVGATAAIINASFYSILAYAMQFAAMTYLLCFLAACLLRVSASWQTTAGSLLILALAVIVVIQYCMPEYIALELRFLLAILGKLNQGDYVADLLSKLDESSKAVFANYLFGVKALSLEVSVLSALVTARYIQSLLFYPEGFRKELLLFRANTLALLLLVLAIIGAYKSNLVAVSCLPVLAAYLTVAGISLGFNILHKKKNRLVLLIIFVPLFVVPYVMLPFYAILGSLDSLFNFRIRMPIKAGE